MLSFWGLKEADISPWAPFNYFFIWALNGVRKVQILSKLFRLFREFPKIWGVPLEKVGIKLAWGFWERDQGEKIMFFGSCKN